MLCPPCNAAIGQGLGGLATIAAIVPLAAHQATDRERRTRRIDIRGALFCGGAGTHSCQAEDHQDAMTNGYHAEQGRGAIVFD